MRASKASRSPTVDERDESLQAYTPTVSSLSHMIFAV